MKDKDFRLNETIETKISTLRDRIEHDSNFAAFKDHYDDICSALRSASQNEHSLLKKCKALNEEVSENVIKVQTALKLSKEDESTIHSMKDELEKAWQKIDMLQNNSTDAESKVDEMMTNISELNEVLDQQKEVIALEKARCTEVVDERKLLENTISKKSVIVEDLRDQIKILNKELSAEKRMNVEVADALHQTQADLKTKSHELFREIQTKEKMHDEIKSLNEKASETFIEGADLKKECGDLNTIIRSKDIALKDQKMSMEKQKVDIAVLTSKLKESEADLERRYLEIEEERIARKKVGREFDFASSEIGRLEKDLKVGKRCVEREKKRALFYSTQVDDCKANVGTCEEMIKKLSKQNVDSVRREERLKKEVERLIQDKNIVQKDVEKEKQKVREKDEDVKDQQRVAKSLESDVKQLHRANVEQKQETFQVEKQKNRLLQKTDDALEKVKQTDGALKLTETQLLNEEKRSALLETKLSQQQQLYEQTRTERNVYSKQLLETEEDFAEVRRKIKVLVHQVEQLKEEIVSKDRALIKEHFEYKTLAKSENQVKLELSRTKCLVEDNQKLILTQNGEVSKLSAIIKELDGDVIKHKKEYKSITQERDVLSRHIVRKNDELSFLQEKQRLLESTLQKGNSQFGIKLKEIQHLQSQLEDVKRELSLKREENKQIDLLKKDVARYSLRLKEEEIKVGALAHELERPVNVHRFRFLQTTNPEKLELMEKVSSLQRRLIMNTEKTVEQKIAIEEKEIEVEEMKKNIQKQNDSRSLLVQLNACQKQNLDKTSKLKLALAELQTKSSLNEDLQHEQDLLKKENLRIKEKLRKKENYFALLN